MNDLIEFLVKCNDEDEAAAKAAAADSGPHWLCSPNFLVGGWWVTHGQPPEKTAALDLATSNVAGHASRHDPARVLRECAARRRILSYVGVEDAHNPDEDCPDCGIMYALAQSYADRPGFREEWRVS